MRRMAKLHTHRGSSVRIYEDAGERVEVPAEGGYVVCRFGGGYGGFWMDPRECIPLSGSLPHSRWQDALETIVQSIEQLWKSEQRERIERFEAPVAAVDLPLPTLESSLFWGEDIELPLEVVLGLMNATPSDCPARLTALAALKGSKSASVLGVVQAADGTLAFDRQRYSVAIYRRKQKRRAEAALESVKKAVLDIAEVNDYLDHEFKVSTAQGLGVEGEPILAMPPPPVELFASVSQALPQGLTGANNVHARVRERQSAQGHDLNLPDGTGGGNDK